MKLSCIEGLIFWVLLTCIPLAAAGAVDNPTKAPPAALAQASSWTGFYIGANVGESWGNVAPGFVDNDIGNYLTFGAGQAANLALVDSVGTMPLSNSGTIGGVEVGYLRQFKPFVFGLEADFQYFNPRGSATHGGAYSDGVPFAFDVTTSGSWLTTVRARIGVPVNHFLFYVTPGVAAELCAEVGDGMKG